MCRLVRSSAEVVVQGGVAGGLTGAVVRVSAAAFGADPLRCPMFRPRPVKRSALAAVMSGVAGRFVSSCWSRLVRRPVVTGDRIGSWRLECWAVGSPARSVLAGESVLFGSVLIRCGRTYGCRRLGCGHLRRPCTGGRPVGPCVCSRPSAEFERCYGTCGDEQTRDGRSHPLAIADGRPTVPVARLDTPWLIGLGRDASARRRWRVVQHPA